MNRAKRNIDWIESMCAVPEGKHIGEMIQLRKWQRDILTGIYNSPSRRAIVSYGRKNGKTALAAMLLLLHLCGPEARANSQLFSAAQSRDQASILFALAAKMVRMNETLSHFVKIRDTAKHIYCQELGTLYRALSADASTAYGLSPVFIVHDELGQVKGPRSELYEALETACAAQDEPLSFVISTQSPTDGDLLSVLIDDAKTGKDPKTKLFMFSADLDVDPFSVKALRQANPAYGDFQNADEVKSQQATAKRMPSRENSYRNLILNQRISQHTPFIARAMWARCAGPIDMEVFSKNPVYIGLDLSARNDLTALAMVANDAGVWHAHLDFFAPEDGLADRSQRDRAPYDVWASQDYITLCPSATIQYEWVAQRLIELCDDYDVRVIAFDRWRIDDLKFELSKLGAELPLEKYGQGFKDMAPAIDEVEAVVSNSMLLHGNNPVLTWCAANSIVISDPTGNRKLDKNKSTGRIDGMIALCMAMGIVSKTEKPTVPYSDHGLRIIDCHA